jgi:excisionase family DNA binding protein
VTARALVPLLTVDDAARLLAVSAQTVRRMLDDGQLTKVLVRGAVRVREAEIIEWLDPKKDGRSAERETSSASASPTPGDATSSPRANAIRARLREKRLRSTPRPSPSEGRPPVVVPLRAAKPKTPSPGGSRT